MPITIDKREMAQVVRVLNTVDKDLVKDLRLTMSRGLRPLGEQIARRANSVPIPMSGMTPQKSRSKWRWGKLRVKVTVDTRYSRGSTTLVSIDFNAVGRYVGMYIAERAGSQNLSRTNNRAKGERFVRRLNYVVPGWEKGGRFMFKASLPYHKHIWRLGENIMIRWAEKTSQQLEKI